MKALVLFQQCRLRSIPFRSLRMIFATARTKLENAKNVKARLVRDSMVVECFVYFSDTVCERVV